MRPSLFNYVAPQPPRIQPNLWARTARFAFRNAAFVVALWAVLLAILLAVQIFAQPSQRNMSETFFSSGAAAENLARFNQQFPNLEALITITLHNPNSSILKRDRNTLLAQLGANPKLYAMVFAPGAGDYYDKHAIYYYSAEEIRNRVDYAKSLAPLFNAVAAQPTTQSLATLVNEVSASITLGRDPQGLDALFVESAGSVKALMAGDSQPVDWLNVAGLNTEPHPTDAVILALPKIGRNVEALHLAQQAVQAVNQKELSTANLQSSEAPVKTGAAPKQVPVGPIIALSIILLAFMFFMTLGSWPLTVLVLAPVIMALSVASAVMKLSFANPYATYWPMFIGLILCAIQISIRMSFAVVESLMFSKARQSAVMLAFQKQGGGLVWLGALACMAWSGWAALSQQNFIILFASFVLGIVTALLAAFILIPALARLIPTTIRWNAARWLLPVYDGIFNNFAWRRLRVGLAILIFVGAITSFLTAPPLAQPKPVAADTVNIVTQSQTEAEVALKALKAIPQAMSVRWVGAFLPQQGNEKHQLLASLKNQFPHFDPVTPQEPSVLRDQITDLLNSLEDIASSSAARPELQKAAHEFRRALALLADTGTDAEVLAFENQIFGTFNQLAEHANALAELEAPEIDSFDPNLRRLFVSEKNVFRLEVTPKQGTNANQLSRILASQGLPVASEALDAENQAAATRAATLRVLGVGLALCLILLIFATGEIAGAVAAVITFVLGLAALAGLALWSKTPLGVASLAEATTVFAALLLLVSNAFLKRQITDQAPPDAFHATEAWLPTAALAAAAVPVWLLSSTDWSLSLGILVAACSLLTISVALLLRPITIGLRRLMSGNIF